jgi:hypothetical protein
MYQSIEDSFDNLYRNTAIPDETFGPDEERIFIDVDPYDLNESIFGLQHNSDIKSTTSTTEKADDEFVAKPDIDYIEESLKNVKRQWQESRGEHDNRWTTSKSHVQDAIMTNPVVSLENAGTDTYYLEDSSTRKEIPVKEGGSSVDAKNGDKSINHGNSRTDDSFTVTSTTSHENWLRISPDQNHHNMSHTNRSTIEYNDAFLDEEEDKEENKRKTEARAENRTTDYAVRFLAGWDPENREGREDTTLTDDRQPSVIEEDSDEDMNLSQEDRVGFVEKALVDLKNIAEERQRSSDEGGLANVSTFASVTRKDDTTKDPILETLAALGKTFI